MELLDKSQTFVGVLATIVILCVVANSGNFIIEIFKGVVKDTRKEIKKCLKHVDDISKELVKSEEYQQLIDGIEYCETLSIDASSEMSNKILLYKIELSVRTECYLNKYGSIFKRLYTRITELKDTREQTFAPLYVFGFCIMLFLCDEIGRWNPDLIEISISFLSYFMLISMIFWGFIWYKFLNECGKCDIVKEISNITNATRLTSNILMRNALSEQSNKSHRFKNWIKQFAVCALFLCVFWFSCIILQWKFKDMPLWCVWSMLILFSIGVFSWRGYIHHKTSLRQGKYSHKLLITHFIALTLLSIVFVSLFYIPSVPDNRIPYENLYMFRLICIGFILTNGILFPFIFPYYADKQVLSVAKELDLKVSDKLIVEGKKLNKDLNETLQKIKFQLVREKEYKIECEEERQLEFKILGTDCDIKSMNALIK